MVRRLEPFWETPLTNAINYCERSTIAHIQSGDTLGGILRGQTCLHLISAVKGVTGEVHLTQERNLHQNATVTQFTSEVKCKQTFTSSLRGSPHLLLRGLHRASEIPFCLLSNVISVTRQSGTLRTLKTHNSRIQTHSFQLSVKPFACTKCEFSKKTYPTSHERKNFQI